MVNSAASITTPWGGIPSNITGADHFNELEHNVTHTSASLVSGQYLICI